MGIKQLKKIIKKYAPNAIIPFDLCDLKGKKIAIDSSILLYRFRYRYNSDNFHILGFTSKIKELADLGVEPYFVFDGTPPKAKERVLSERSELRKKQISKLTEIESQLKNYDLQYVSEFIDSDSENTENVEDIKNAKTLLAEQKKIKKNLLIVTKTHSLEVMDYLKSLGIAFCQAETEAEKHCAYLQKTGQVDYILTEDTDALPFGGSNIIFQNELCDLKLVLEGLGLTFESFVDFCILCGCDYTSTIPKVGPVSALKLIKRYITIENIIKNVPNVPDSFEYQMARELFKQN
jgi:flap endonuclease-1